MPKTKFNPGSPITVTTALQRHGNKETTMTEKNSIGWGHMVGTPNQMGGVMEMTFKLISEGNLEPR